MVGLMNVMAQELRSGIAVNGLFPNAVGGRLGGKPGDFRPDAEYLAEAGKRVPGFIEGMQPSFPVALLTYLPSAQRGTSQNMYSVLGGKYSRIFVRLTEGWYYPGKMAPEPEEIIAHLP
jgi:hypothetical protein